VSPFMPWTLEYEWTFAGPGTTVSVHMEDFDKEGRIFRGELTAERGRSPAVRSPLMLLKYPV